MRDVLPLWLQIREVLFFIYMVALKGKLLKPAEYPGCSGSRNIQDNISDLKAQVAANHKVEDILSVKIKKGFGERGYHIGHWLAVQWTGEVVTSRCCISTNHGLASITKKMKTMDVDLWLSCAWLHSEILLQWKHDVTHFLFILATVPKSKNPAIHLYKSEKQLGPFKGTVGEVSFKKSRNSISSTDSNVKTTVYVALVSTSEVKA